MCEIIYSAAEARPKGEEGAVSWFLDERGLCPRGKADQRMDSPLPAKRDQLSGNSERYGNILLSDFPKSSIVEGTNEHGLWYSSLIRQKMARNPDPDPGADMLRHATSYVYASWWMYKFYFRQAIVGKLLPWVLGVLFTIEVLGPLTHLWELPSPAKYVVSSLLLLTAVVLIYHHRKLQLRISRHNVLLSSVMVLLEDESLGYADRRSDREASEKAISDALEALAFAIEHHDPGHVVNASVLVRRDIDEPFELLAQDPQRRFRKDVMLHPLNSVAGKVSEEDFGALLYVPRTDFIHAVRIAPERRLGIGGIFQTARIVPNAFQKLEKDPDVLKCLLCVKIHVESDAADGACAVLCLSRDQYDSMGELEFQAIKVAGALISLAMEPSIITEKKQVNRLPNTGYF